LRDKTNADDATKEDLTAGIEAANRVLKEANDAVDQELLREARDDMESRVEDWKNHQIDQFGDLLLYGHFPVVNGKSDGQKEVRPLTSPLTSFSNVQKFSALRLFRDSSVRKAPNSTERRSIESIASSEQSLEGSQLGRYSTSSQKDDGDDQRQSTNEDTFLSDMLFHQFSGCHPETGDPILAKRFADSMGITAQTYEQYTIYLFERILLCCKEINPNKSKDKVMGMQKDKKDKNKSKEPNKNAKLQLKGRIFMTNVTDVIALGKQGN
jgi:cell division control protein 24